MNRLTIILAVVTVTLGLSGEAFALAPFKKAWQKKYLESHKNEKFVAEAKKAGCNVCHIKDSKVKKHYQNEYGQLINKLIKGDANKRKKEAEDSKAEMEKILKEFEAALDKVSKQKSNGGKGPTYGELIKEGKLPVDIEAAKKKHYADEKKRKSGDSAVEK